MKYQLQAKLDELEFGVWDPDTETIINGPEDIKEYLSGLSTKKAIAVLADSLDMFCDDLKELVKKDLADCYERESE